MEEMDVLQKMEVQQSSSSEEHPPLDSSEKSEVSSFLDDKSLGKNPDECNDAQRQSLPETGDGRAGQRLQPQALLQHHVLAEETTPPEGAKDKLKEDDEKRLQKRLRNNEASQRSRKKRNTLEQDRLDRVKKLEKENDELRHQNAMLLQKDEFRHELAELRQKVDELCQKVDELRQQGSERLEDDAQRMEMNEIVNIALDLEESYGVPEVRNRI